MISWFSSKIGRITAAPRCVGRITALHLIPVHVKKQATAE